MARTDSRLGEIGRPLGDPDARLGEIQHSRRETNVRLGELQLPLGGVETQMEAIGEGMRLNGRSSSPKRRPKIGRRRSSSSKRSSELARGRSSSPIRSPKRARGRSSSPKRSSDLASERSSSTKRPPGRPKGSSSSANRGSVSSKLEFTVDQERHVRSLGLLAWVRSHARNLTKPGLSFRAEGRFVYCCVFCGASDGEMPTLHPGRRR